jgi:hypothetical protein
MGPMRRCRSSGMDTNRPTPHRNEGRRLKIAAGVITGKSLAQIGREEGVSRQTISKQLASSDARQIIVNLTNRELDRLSLLFSQVLQAISEGLEARRVQVQNGVVIDLGPDHFARLTAVSRLLQVLTAGRPFAKVLEQKAPEDGADLRHEAQLLVAGRAATQASPKPSRPLAQSSRPPLARLGARACG